MGEQPAASVLVVGLLGPVDIFIGTAPAGIPQAGPSERRERLHVELAFAQAQPVPGPE